MNLSNGTKVVIEVVSAWLNTISGSISAICSAAIIYMMLSDRERKLRKEPKCRFLLMMSIIDVLQSIAYAFSSLPVPRESGIYGARGNQMTCNTQGFLFQLGFAVPCYNACLCIWFLRSIKYNMHPNEFRKNIEPYCHTVSLLLPLTTAILCTVLDTFEPRGPMCWIGNEKSSMLFLVVKLLIQSNKKALKLTNETGKTPLAVACVSGVALSTLRELVSASPATLRVRDVNNFTPVDLLWSSFSKTLPGASAISKFLKRDNGDNQVKEMSGLLFRFHEKISLCLSYSYALSKENQASNVDARCDAKEDKCTVSCSLLCHAIISEDLKYCPHTLLAIFLTHEGMLGSQVDEDGNTPLHLQINRKWQDKECISVLLEKSKESAGVPNNAGMFPLHLILEKMIKETDVKVEKFTFITRQIIKAFPDATEMKDPNTLFYPFMLAAVANNLSLSYELLQQYPNVISSFLRRSHDK